MQNIRGLIVQIIVCSLIVDLKMQMTATCEIDFNYIWLHNSEMAAHELEFPKKQKPIKLIKLRHKGKKNKCYSMISKLMHNVVKTVYIFKIINGDRF